MGAIADWDEYIRMLQKPKELVPSFKNLSVSVAGRLVSEWTATPALNQGVAPTTAAVPTKTLLGAIPDWQNGGSDTLYIAGGAMQVINIGAVCPGSWLLCDRLSHQGGLDGTVTSAQTTNLPTAALTRYTSGEGVWMGLEIYTVIGTTATTVSCSYTDQAGNTGHTSPTVAFGASNFREAGRVIVMPLAAGDTGVRAVANVTVTGTTGTVGNFGVTLFKPLLMISAGAGYQTEFDPVISGTCGGGLPELVDDSCLFWLPIATSGNTGTGSFRLHLTET